MTHTPAKPLLIAALVAGATGLSPAESVAQDRAGLATYRNERHGFTVSYPAAQFVALTAATEDARMFVSNDDKARLLVGTLPNSDSKTLGEYRSFLLRESYAGAKIDYAPMRKDWFVLSGTRNGTSFYQRVTFTCGGRSITSWALLYPEAQRATYDRIVEQVHRSYRAGPGNCD
ncbi:MAG: hypothetical protein F9K29_23310 [Hyphomicrobiaceae bacterium]|nr:MAG: hypothetical protein F9K29_23310 [Hyphomicrobiaceae bacterium]